MKAAYEKLMAAEGMPVRFSDIKDGTLESLFQCPMWTLIFMNNFGAIITWSSNVTKDSAIFFLCYQNFVENQWKMKGCVATTYFFLIWSIYILIFSQTRRFQYDKNMIINVDGCRAVVTRFYSKSSWNLLISFSNLICILISGVNRKRNGIRAWCTKVELKYKFREPNS